MSTVNIKLCSRDFSGPSCHPQVGGGSRGYVHPSQAQLQELGEALLGHKGWVRGPVNPLWFTATPVSSYQEQENHK